MKANHVFLLLLAAGIGFVVLNQTNPSVLGVKSNNNESKEVCWHGTASAEKYQLFFGQASTGNKDSAIYEGLDNRSKCVKLSYLKPCTTYIWNLQRRDGGKWSWQWASDQRFVTAGTCEVTPVVSPANVVQGNGSAVATWTTTNGATKYYIYYRRASDPNWAYAVEIPAKSTSYTINYLSTNSGYMYRVAAVVDNKLVWQEERNLVVQ